MIESERREQLRFDQWYWQTRITRPFSAHSCRHIFVFRLYQRTGDPYLVQRALGHRQITTTEIYARVGDDELRHAVSGVG